MITKRCFITILLFFTFNNASFGTSIEEKINEASIYIEYGELDKALNIIKSIPTNKKNEYKLKIALGRVSLKLGKYEEANSLFEDALFSIELNDSEAYLGIAKANLESGKLINAYKYLRPLLRENKDIIETEIITAEIELRSGYAKDAYNRLEKLIQIRPKDDKLAAEYAKILFFYKDSELAQAFLESFIIKNEMSPVSHEQLSYMKERSGLLKESNKYLLKASTLYQKQGKIIRANILKDIIKARENLSITVQTIEENPHRDKENSSEANRSEIGEVLEKVEDESDATKFHEKDSTLIEKNKEAIADKDHKENEIVKPNKEEKPLEVNNIFLSKSLQKQTLNTSWLEEVSDSPDYNPFKKDFYFGSGFVINTGKYIITNYHVIENTSIVYGYSGKGEIFVASNAYFDKQKDLAILELIQPMSNSEEIISINNFEDPKAGSEALVIGYPLPDFIGGSMPTITEGMVSKESGLNDHPGTVLMLNRSSCSKIRYSIFPRRIGYVT